MTLQSDLRHSGDTGTVLGGRYRLDGVIGRGGMSVVHAATDLALGRRVAIKVLAPEVAERDRRRLDDELSLLAGLDHPGLVTVFDAVRTAGSDDPPAVVMQLIEGKDLAQRLAVSPLAPPAVARLGADIASALAYLADRTVVHRDVKPANILLTPDCRALLTDFGIAQLVGSRGPTGTGTIIGTMRYLSPEQVRGQQATAASDVYALGLVLLEALTGRPAFSGTDAETAAARLTRPPVIPAALGTAWTAVLTAMTTVDPAQRCTADWAAERLSELADRPFLMTPPPAGGATAPLPVVEPAPVPPPRERTARRRSWIAALVALGLVLAAGAGVAAQWFAAPPPGTGPRAQMDLVVTPVQTVETEPEVVSDDSVGPGNGPDNAGPGKGPKNDGPKDGGPGNGPKNDGPKNDGPKNDEPKNDEPKNDGPKDDGSGNGGPGNGGPGNGGPGNGDG